MILETRETQIGFEVTLKPETLEEVAQLVRISMNAKRESPNIYFSFSGSKPWWNMFIKKIHANKQVNYISTRKK